MLVWMREYNAAHEKKVKFYGFDSRPVFRCTKVVYDYLRKINGTRDYDDILLEWITLKFDKRDKDRMTSMTGPVKELISYLESQRPAAGEDTKERRFAVINSKVLWAANPHITVLPGSGCMGAYLRKIYGEEMLVIALAGNDRGGLEELLTAAGLDISVLDFRSLPKGIVREYLNSPLRDGGIYTIYPMSYDAVLFIISTCGADMITTQDYLFKIPEL